MASTSLTTAFVAKRLQKNASRQALAAEKKEELRRMKRVAVSDPPQAGYSFPLS